MMTRRNSKVLITHQTSSFLNSAFSNILLREGTLHPLQWLPMLVPKQVHNQY